METKKTTNASEFWFNVKTAFSELRTKQSFKEFCTKNNICYQTLLNQKCQNRYPSVEYLIRLSKGLKVSLDSLITVPSGSKLS